MSYMKFQVNTTGINRGAWSLYGTCPGISTNSLFNQVVFRFDFMNISH